jgi:cyclopropane fatty-acyl-phospholipid synthase-like methyltransferase
MSVDFWEGHYQSGDMPWEKGEPSPGLVDFLAANPQLTRGTVCVPGCGTGHDVVAWARAGFKAFAYDIAPSAVKLTTDRLRSAGLPQQVQLANFLTDTPSFQFDWVFEHTLFCAIQPNERDEYVKAVVRWLKPEGHYLAVNYLIPDTDGPPFGTTREELLERFSSQFELLKDWVPRSYPNRTGLERILWWRRKQS